MSFYADSGSISKRAIFIDAFFDALQSLILFVGLAAAIDVIVNCRLLLFAHDPNLLHEGNLRVLDC